MPSPVINEISQEASISNEGLKQVERRQEAVAGGPYAGQPEVLRKMAPTNDQILTRENLQNQQQQVQNIQHLSRAANNDALREYTENRVDDNGHEGQREEVTQQAL